jgi:hypothetical protein
VYDPATTALHVQAASQAQGWPLHYHTVAQCQTAIDHLDTLIQEQEHEKQAIALKRPLTSEEQWWIRNERKLCALDFRYYCTRYAWIIDWKKHAVRFTPNVAQSIVLDVWGDLERKGQAIMMQQLKARQLGVSTLTEIAVGHRVQFVPNTNAVVASADPSKSVKMAAMIDFSWSHQPWWLLPRTTKIEKGMPVEFEDLNTSILIQAGNQFNGVARGQTPNVFHLSELCEWEDPDLLVDAALLKAIHETPDVFGILESTALGRGNWWHDTWKQVREDFPLGKSRLCPIFLPWFVGIDIYPTETDLRMRPIPHGWLPSETTHQHAEQARQYVLSNPLLLQHLAHGDQSWSLPLAQQWYYEIERDAALKKKQLNLFLSEMPATDTEAFQSTNISAFDPEVILAHRSRVRPPVGVYTITGTGIPNELVIPPRHWDTTKPPITIRAGDLLQGQKEEFSLVPVKFEGYSGGSAGLKLFVWEPPEPDAEYIFGVDTSDGVGQDWTVMNGLRKRFPHGADYQVAEFGSPYIKALQLWPHVLALACYYSVHQSKVDRRVQCRVAIECRGNGETVQWELQKRRWFNFHPWKRLDNKKRITNDKVHKMGVFTSSWYRPMMMDRLLSMLEDEAVEVYSPYFVDEMEALEKDEVRQSLKAVYGEHDDRIMSLGFALDSAHVDDPPYGRNAFARSPRYFAQSAIDPHPPVYAAYQPPIHALDLRKPSPQVFIRGQRRM